MLLQRQFQSSSYVVFTFLLLLLFDRSTQQYQQQRQQQNRLSDIRKCRDAAFAVPKPSNGLLLACCRYSKLKFQCTGGYKLHDGDEIVTCKRGRIYGKFPKCVPIRQYPCGKSSFPIYGGRVVGGKESRLADWPWMAAIYLDNAPKCGGTLISDSHILTAAHCCYNFIGTAISNPSRYKAFLGLTDLRNPGNQSIERTISKIWTHQDFSMSTFKNDIAVLELSSPVKTSAYVRPICLPAVGLKMAAPDRLSYIAGWGKTVKQSRSQIRGRHSNELKHVAIPIAPDGTCSAATRKSEPYDKLTMLCAGTGRGGVDACHGDSGGPLMVFDTYKTRKGKVKLRWTLAGVVSWGSGCAIPGTYGYYTRLSTYTQWIKDRLK